MTTSERRASRSRIYACWRVLFAIVGGLDCSCFCYCYYYHKDYSSDKNHIAPTKMQPPRLCPLQEEWQYHDLNRGDDCYATIEIENSSDTTKTRPPERPLSSPFQNRSLSSLVWQSMPFSYHPSTRKRIVTVDTNNNTGTKTPFRHLDDNVNSYHAFLLLHLGFGILCGIEMILRAIEARRIVFENQAIAAFEEHIAATVAKVYHRRKLLRGKRRFSYYTLRRPSVGTTAPTPTTTSALKRNPYIPSFSFSLPNDTSTAATVRRSHHVVTEGNEASPSTNENNSYDDEGIQYHGETDVVDSKDPNTNNDDDTIDMDDEAANERNIRLFLQSTFRLWLPIGVTCFFWLSLLPFQAYYRIIRIFLNDCFNYPIGNICTDGNGGWDEDELLDGDRHCDIDCSDRYGSHTAAACYVETLGSDTAWATLWITTFLAQWTEICEGINDYLMTAVWKRYLLGGLFQTHAHKKLHKILLNKPKLIWFRLGRILNIVKWVRFAGPLARMVLKLQDQLRMGYSIFQKVRSVRTNRERRLQRPSLLLRDLRRIESFHKIETTIASWPSQCSMLLETLAKEASQYSAPTSVTKTSSMATFHAEEFLRKSRERGRQIKRQIQWLQGQLRRGVTEFSSSEVCDRILRLSKDLSKRHLLVDHGDSDHENDEDCDEDKGNENKTGDAASSNKYRSRRSAKSRWYDFLHLENLLSSHDHLISPRSRFSVVWRITVTNCLLLTLARLSVSWYLTQTFHLSFRQVIGRLFVDCGTIEEDTKRKFRFFTDLIQEWHAGLSHAIPFVPFPKESLWILCVPTSRFSKLLLLLGSTMETFIDVVSFLDIFFWFFTGDLDASTGIVVPKAFFGRCILPGTLVQIIDHPTLPDFLPSVLGKLAVVAVELGWSRLVLWSCALVPALVAEVIMPLSAYFFRHFEEIDNGSGGGNNNDLLMTYAESFGYLPTSSSHLLETMPAPLWVRNTHANDRSSQSHSSSDDDDDVDNFRIDGGFVRRLHPGILTPPGSPKRKSLRGLTSPRLHDSSVRFAKDVSTASIEDEYGSPRLYGSSADFDLGLSLSSHTLNDLK